MSVEAKIYSPRPPLTVIQLVTAANQRGLQLRFLLGISDDFPDQPLNLLLNQHLVVIGWDANDAPTTTAVDAAFAARRKSALDALGRSEQLAWCELTCTPFNYDQFWQRFPHERDEYEQSTDPDVLRIIQQSTTRYSLRSSTAPAQCGRLLARLLKLLAIESGGVIGE